MNTYSTLIEEIKIIYYEKKKRLTLISNGKCHIFISNSNFFKKTKKIIYNLQRIGMKPSENLIIQTDDNSNIIDDLSFIQLSSGSTIDSGVVIPTHEKLITNIDDNDSTLSWKHLTYNMCLLGFHFVPLYSQLKQFIRLPTLWLKKAFECKTTLLSSLNFGYKYLLDRYELKDSENWDLLHIRILFNGAEPISAKLSN